MLSACFNIMQPQKRWLLSRLSDVGQKRTCPPFSLLSSVCQALPKGWKCPVFWSCYWWHFINSQCLLK